MEGETYTHDDIVRIKDEIYRLNAKLKVASDYVRSKEGCSGLYEEWNRRLLGRTLLSFGLQEVAVMAVTEVDVRSFGTTPRLILSGTSMPISDDPEVYEEALVFELGDGRAKGLAFDGEDVGCVDGIKYSVLPEGVGPGSDRVNDEVKRLAGLYVESMSCRIASAYASFRERAVQDIAVITGVGGKSGSISPSELGGMLDTLIDIAGSMQAGVENGSQGTKE